MKVTIDQFFVFSALFSLGFLFGIIYTIIILPFEIKKSVLLKNIVNILLFLILSILFIIIYNALKMPNFRVYMFISVLLGFFVCYKTFRVMLAKLLIKVYNKIVYLRRRK